jgi:hypothetical protein
MAQYPSQTRACAACRGSATGCPASLHACRSAVSCGTEKCVSVTIRNLWVEAGPCRWPAPGPPRPPAPAVRILNPLRVLPPSRFLQAGLPITCTRPAAAAPGASIGTPQGGSRVATRRGHHQITRPQNRVTRSRGPGGVGWGRVYGCRRCMGCSVGLSREIRLQIGLGLSGKGRRLVKMEILYNVGDDTPSHHWVAASDG